jgi:hypothetical protein
LEIIKNQANPDASSVAYFTKAFLWVSYALQ